MKVEKKYIYQLRIRLLHAILSFCILSLIATAKLAGFYFESGRVACFFWDVHLIFGYLFSFALIIRLSLFFSQDPYSNWRSFIHPDEWRSFFIQKSFREIKWKWGHHPLASLAYIAVYAGMFISMISGLALARIEFDRGPIWESLFDELKYVVEITYLHELISDFLILFIVLHLGSLLVHTLKDGVPIFQSMKNGYQYRKRG